MLTENTETGRRATRIYLSIPISGYPIETVKKNAENYKRGLERRFKHGNCEVITPFDVCDEKDKPYSYYMGEDVKALLECDMVYFAFGWQCSKGCMAEFEIARIYGKTLLFD